MISAGCSGNYSVATLADGRGLLRGHVPTWATVAS